MAQLAQSTSLKGSTSGQQVTQLGVFNFRLNDAVRTARYLHFKTNVPIGGDDMIMIEAKGYNYATGQVIDCTWSWYSYSVGNVLLNTALHNAAAGLVPNLVYHSSDGFVCFSAAASDLYYIGVNLNAYSPCPNGNGFAVAITNTEATTFAGPGFIPAGEQSYTTAGTYTFTVPTGVTSISAVVIGGGGGAVSSSPYYKSGGGGGGLRYINGYTVTPGQAITVVVGARGIRNPDGTIDPTPGGTSSLASGGVFLFASGGANGTRTSVFLEPAGGMGSTIAGNIGGANGGVGGGTNSSSAGAGGGGAAGYTGNGGKGSSNSGTASAAGTGGGGGGGGHGTSSSGSGRGGGGVGLFGQGPNGTAGASGTNGAPGVGGSGGTTAGNVLNSFDGGLYGGGAPGGQSGNSGTLNGNGGGGAVRIVWGSGRSFPSAAGQYGPYPFGWVIAGSLLFAVPDGTFGNDYTAAAAAAAASTLGGYDDWRIPTYAEMQSLVTQANAATLISYGWASGTGDWHWTSTVQGGANYYVYAPGQTGGSPVGFSFGTGNYRVAMVRAI